MTTDAATDAATDATAALTVDGMSREDLEARSGSATALLRTVVGAVLRPIGGWLSAAGAVALMGSLDVPAATARSSLARLCSRGVLVREQREGVAGYAVDPAALPMLERGDARIFGRREAAEAVEAAERWCLVSFSFPEHRRSQRHRLRSRLAALGCGTVADGLWIAPAALEAEVAEAVQEVEAAGGAATLFGDAAVRGDLADGLARWYDLPAIRALHDSFLARFAGLEGDGAPADDRAAFAAWIRALDEWRVIPYRDPGLPASALPPDWPGAASAALFARLRRELEPRAVRYAAHSSAR
jgi:phenylacetic acid degradation operon negative regulatory protein